MTFLDQTFVNKKSTFAIKANLIKRLQLGGPNIAHWSAPSLWYLVQQARVHTTPIESVRKTYPIIANPHHKLVYGFWRIRRGRKQGAEAFDGNFPGKPIESNNTDSFRNLQARTADNATAPKLSSDTVLGGSFGVVITHDVYIEHAWDEGVLTLESCAVAKL